MSPEHRILACVIIACSIVASTALVALYTNPRQAKLDKAHQWGFASLVITAGCAVTMLLI